MSLPPRQQQIADYLRGRGGAWVSTQEIFDAVFGPGKTLTNVKVMIFRAIRNGAPIQTDGRGCTSRGYRWAGES